MLPDQLSELALRSADLQPHVLTQLRRSRAGLGADISLAATALSRTATPTPRSFHMLDHASKRLCSANNDHLIDWMAVSASTICIRNVSGIHGWRRLQRRIHSDRGFENQVIATAYLANHVRVQEVEGRVGPVPCDATIKIGRQLLPVEIKTVDQNAKWSALLDALTRLGAALHEALKREGKDIRLGVRIFEGVAPAQILEHEVQRFITPIPVDGEERHWRFENGYSVRVQFGERTNGTIALTDSMRNFETHCKHVEKVGAASGRPGPFMVSVVSSGLTRRMNESYIKKVESHLYRRSTLGFLFLDFAFHDSYVARRSKVFTTQHSPSAVLALEAALPREWEGPFELPAAGEA